MAISQEEYDKINVGDTLIVAAPISIVDRNEYRIYEGVVRGGNWYGEDKPWAIGEGNYMPFNIIPDKGGKQVTILKHTKAPKPDPLWWSARVIVVGDDLYLRTRLGEFRDSTGEIYARDTIGARTDLEVKIILQ